MKLSILGRFAFCISAAAALLTGCAGSSAGRTGALGEMPQNVQAPLNAGFASPDTAKIILVGTGWVAPSGVAVDGEGNVYVGEWTLGEVKKVSPPFTGRTHGKIRVIARGIGTPTSVALDGKGNVYVSLDDNPPGVTILQITPSGIKNTVTTKIDAFGVAVDASENVYAAGGIVRGPSAFYALYFIAHKPGGGWKSPVKIQTSKITNAMAVALNARDNLYALAQPTMSGVTPLKVEPDGKLIPVGSGYKGPEDLAISLGCADSCAVYVSDTFNNEVKKVTPPFTGPTHGKITLVGYGFNYPTGVAAKGGDVYVIDSGNLQVKEVIP